MTPFYRRDFPGAAISFTCVFAMAFSLRFSGCLLPSAKLKSLRICLLACPDCESWLVLSVSRLVSAARKGNPTSGRKFDFRRIFLLVPIQFSRRLSTVNNN